MKPVILLVDDEILALNYLKGMIQDEIREEFDIVESLSAGKAMELFERHLPVIVITDIRMPGVDGLEFCRWVRTRYPRTKILLLTSYSDFEYAQKAIQLAVDDYILKHTLSRELVHEKLAVLKTKIRNEQNQLQLQRRRLLEKMVKSGTVPEQWLELSGTRTPHAVPVKYVLAMLKKDSSLEESEGDSPESHGLFQFLGDSLQEILECQESGLAGWDVFKLNDHYCCVLFAVDTKLREAEIYSNMTRAIRLIQKVVETDSKESVSAFITGPFTDISLLCSKYEKLAKFSFYSVFFGSGSIVSADGRDIPESVQGTQQEWEILERFPVELDQLLEKIDADGVRYCIGEAFKHVHKSFNHWNLRKLVSMLDDKYEKFTGRKSPGSTSGNSSIKAKRRQALQTIEGMMRWYQELFAGSMAEMLNNRDSGISKLASGAIAYIRSHLSEELSLVTISNALNVSGDYLRHVFKDETGQTVTDYITCARIEKAKELLADGRYKIYEIAEMTGFNTSQYFSSVFRKMTGVSPADYAKD